MPDPDERAPNEPRGTAESGPARVLRQLRGAASRNWRGVGILLVCAAAVYTFMRVVDVVQPIGTWLSWQLFQVWGYALLLWTACASFGAMVLRRVIRHEAPSALETLALAIPVGLLSFNVAMYAGGAFGLFRPWFGVGLPVVMLAAGAVDLAKLPRGFRDPETPVCRSSLTKLIQGLATVFGAMAAFVLYLQIMTPEAINFDAAWSHLPIAQDYAREHRIVAFNADYTRCFPHLASIIHTYAFLVPLKPVALRWMLAIHDEYCAVLSTLLGVGALVDRLVGRRVPGGWAVFFLFPGILIYDLGIGGAADHYEALFVGPLAIATLHAMGSTDARRWVLAGLFAGAALATKVHAVHVVVPVALMLFVAALVKAIRDRKEAPFARNVNRALVIPLGAFGISLFLAIAPHLIRNAAFHSNPVYPFGLGIFKRSHPVVPQADFLFEYLFKDWNWRPHGTPLQNLKDAFLLFFSFSFGPHYSFTKNVPSFGSLFTLSLAFFPFVRGAKPIALGALLMFGSVMVWGLTFQVDRHLQPFVPIAAGVTGAMLVRAWELGAFARVGVVGLVGSQLVFSGDAISYSAEVYGSNKIYRSLELIRSTYDGRAASRFSQFRQTFLEINAALPKDALVVLHEYRKTLGIDRKIYMDWAGQQGLIDYRPAKTPRDLWQIYHSLGVTHVLWTPNQRPAPSKQEEALFDTFARRYGVHAKRFGEFELFEIPSTPPPAVAPWKALSLGIPGYADGIYPIEAMGTFDLLPPPVRKYAAPEVSIDPNSTDMPSTLANVDVVFLGRDVSDVSRQLPSRFESIGSVGRFTLYVAKPE